MLSWKRSEEGVREVGVFNCVMLFKLRSFLVNLRTVFRGSRGQSLIGIGSRRMGGDSGLRQLQVFPERGDMGW